MNNRYPSLLAVALVAACFAAPPLAAFGSTEETGPGNPPDGQPPTPEANQAEDLAPPVHQDPTPPPAPEAQPPVEAPAPEEAVDPEPPKVEADPSAPAGDEEAKASAIPVEPPPPVQPLPPLPPAFTITPQDQPVPAAPAPRTAGEALVAEAEQMGESTPTGDIIQIKTALQAHRGDSDELALRIDDVTTRLERVLNERAGAGGRATITGQKRNL